MRIVLTILLVFLLTICFSQTIRERENDLRLSENWIQKKDKALELLEIDKFNIVAINYILRLYQGFKQKDSISLFYEKLIENNPNTPDPYLIRVNLSHFESLSRINQIKYLKKAHEIDPLGVATNYQLGKGYYELFIQEFSQNNNKENLDFYGSVSYFYNLFVIDEQYKEPLIYPLIQMTNYLDDSIKYIEIKDYNFQSSYFPVPDLAGLPLDWETNYSVDVICKIKSSLFRLNWYSIFLDALEEPILCDSLPRKIFRFTWLRTFHNPIIIGITNIKDTITLYWKVNDGEGGYEPGKIIEDESRPLSLEEWTGIVNKMNAIGFWDLPSIEKGIYGADGAQWILEGKELGKYHFVDRWSGGEIEKLCLELINLTDLRIKEEDIY